MPLIHRGICAWITSNNVNLPEYSVAADYQTNTVSCFIAGVAGQKFTIWWTNLDGSTGICTFITLDGCRVPGKILYGVGTTYRNGARVTGNTQKPFVFKDSIEGLLSGDISPDTGIITLKVKRVTLEAPVPVKDSRPLPSDAVLGKRKAAGGFHVGFGEEELTEPQLPLTWKLGSTENDAHPGSLPKTFVTFVFRYRSQEHLNSMNMMIGQQIPVIPSWQICLQPSRMPVAQSTEVTEMPDAPARKKQKSRHSSTAITSSHTSPDRKQDIDPPHIPSGSGTIATANISDVHPLENLTSLVTPHAAVASTPQRQWEVDPYPIQSGPRETILNFLTSFNEDASLPFDSAAHRVHQEMSTNLPLHYREDSSYARFAPPEPSSSQIQASTTRKSSKTTARKASKARAVSATNPPMAVSHSQLQSTESKRAVSFNGLSSSKGSINLRDDSNTPPSA